MGERLNTTLGKPTPLGIRREGGEIRVAPPESDDLYNKPMEKVIRGLGVRSENDKPWPKTKLCPSELEVCLTYREGFSKSEVARARRDLEQYVEGAQKEGRAIEKLAKKFGKKPDMKINFDNPLNGETTHQIEGHAIGFVGQHSEGITNDMQYGDSDAIHSRVHWGAVLPPEQAQESSKTRIQLTAVLANLYPDLAKAGKLEEALQTLGPRMRVGLAEALTQAGLGDDKNVDISNYHFYLAMTPTGMATYRGSGKESIYGYRGPYLVELGKYLTCVTQDDCYPGGVDLKKACWEGEPLLALQAAMVARQFRMDFEAQAEARAGARRAQQLGRRATRG